MSRVLLDLEEPVLEHLAPGRRAQVQRVPHEARVRVDEVDARRLVVLVLFHLHVRYLSVSPLNLIY